MEQTQEIDYGQRAVEASVRVHDTCQRYASRLADFEIKHIRDTLKHVIDELQNPLGHTQGIYVGGRDSATPMANTSKAVSAFIRHYNRYYRTKNVIKDVKAEITQNLIKASKCLGLALVTKRHNGKSKQEAKLIDDTLGYINGNCHNWERPFSQPL